jgi:hypothetical protein
MGMKTQAGEKIQFIDQVYEARRTRLRYEYMHNAELHKVIKILAFEVKEVIENKKTIIPEFRKLDVIIQFLVDGFLAYEKIFEYDIHKANIPLDPITIEPEMSGDTKIWIQWRGQPNEKQLIDSNIVYIYYDAKEVSFAQSLYTKLIDYNDIKFIKQHAKQIGTILTCKR